VEDFTALMQACLPAELPHRMGVAVSGGGDSTALLAMLADWAAGHETELFVATVDHGLRDEAAAEAAAVATLCAALGLPHETLKWRGWDGKGNVQDQARKARYRLLTDWAHRNDLPIIALGHTAEDQAETFMIRLLRGSGVDGLSAMPMVRQENGIRWIRPLMGMRRQSLRQYLADRALTWAEDPSNEDVQYERIRLRKTMDALGLPLDGINATALRLQGTRSFLERQTQIAARQVAEITLAGDVLLNRQAFTALDPELQHRLLAHSLKWVATSPYAPRFESLLNLLKNMNSGRKSTLAGCVVGPFRAGRWFIAREFAAVKGLTGPAGGEWDSRWRVSAPNPDPDLKVRALGAEGLKSHADWRAMDLPRSGLLASPALWRDQRLVASVLTPPPHGIRIALAQGDDHYFTSILSH